MTPDMGPRARRAGGADYVVVGGGVHTMDAARTQVEAVAVIDGRVAAVGADHEIRDLAGARTQVIDLSGRMLLPGFIDCHSHAPKAGMDMLRVDLSGLVSVDQYVAAIGTFATAHPDVEWIQGGGWVPEVFPNGTATSAILDAVVPDRPAAFSDADNHRAWANSCALERAGIEKATPDPPTGWIQRADDGTPSGSLHEGAVWLLRRALPVPDVEEVCRAILRAQQVMHALGFVGWQDAIVGDYQLMPNTTDVYPILAARGDLTARVTGDLWWSWDRGLDQLPELVHQREHASGGRYRAGTVKIMQDGTVENHTAGLLESYLHDGLPTHEHGLSMVEPELLRAAVTQLDAAGFQVHFHTIGDRAVREALDAIEAARAANGMNDTRHHLSHVQLVHPNDVPRFRRLRASATIQTLWASLDPLTVELTIPALGEERVAVQFPFQTLVRSGARVATGSDWPISPADPYMQLHTAVTRTVAPGYTRAEANRTRPALGPDERLELQSMLWAMTASAAYVNHLEHETGSIEVGKAADLVVIDQDLFGLLPDRLTSARTLLTMVEGAVVYEAKGW